MKIQRISVCLLWLAAIITLAHTIIPHHHDHQETAKYSKGIEDNHHHGLGNIFHHVHGLGDNDESTYLPHSSQQFDFSKRISVFDIAMFLISPGSKNPVRIFISDYGEPPPIINSRFFLSATSFRGPPAFRA